MLLAMQYHQTLSAHGCVLLLHKLFSVGLMNELVNSIKVAQSMEIFSVCQTHY